MKWVGDLDMYRLLAIEFVFFEILRKILSILLILIRGLYKDKEKDYNYNIKKKIYNLNINLSNNSNKIL